ncbi:MAG: ATP-binding protein [Porcipelethomonas sp.]
MENITLKYNVDSENFSGMGKISDKVREELKKLKFDAETVRRISVALYQGEINMIIHASGGVITVEISDSCITIILKDRGPGIENVEQAMESGFSTASETVRSMGFGEGAGFTIMKKLSDEITVHSKLGEGTEIIMKVYT